MTLDAERACVSPDRGGTRRCLDIGDPASVRDVDVGECASLDGERLQVVDDAACAAGDVGD